MSGCAQKAWNALIRTHHITSRKKVAKLRQAAAAHDVFALLRSGSSPGIMYVEGDKEGVENWVATVQVGAATRHSVYTCRYTADINYLRRSSDIKTFN